MQSNAAKRVHALNPSRYECAFNVRLVLSSTVALQGSSFSNRARLNFHNFGLRDVKMVAQECCL